MSLNEEQPKPTATDRRPAWEMVIEYVEQIYPNEFELKQLIIDDMKERDAIGRKRYGVPLTSGNGRDALVDAYQEALDFAVYLMAWLDENGAFTHKDKDPADVPEHIQKAAGIFTFHVGQQLPMLRDLIEEQKQVKAEQPVKLGFSKLD